LLHGLLVMERGYIFACMILAALAACLIDRRFFAAAAWSGVGAIFTLMGLMHAYQLTGNNLDFLLIGHSASEASISYRAYGVASGYALMGVVFAVIGVIQEGAGKRAVRGGR
ncbi:MAG: NCS2 family permease, partial [Phycisphaerae bacterium]